MLRPPPHDYVGDSGTNGKDLLPPDESDSVALYQDYARSVSAFRAEFPDVRLREGRDVLTRNSQRLKRFYYYQYRGDPAYDAGLVTPDSSGITNAQPANLRRSVFCTYMEVTNPRSTATCSPGS